MYGDGYIMINILFAGQRWDHAVVGTTMIIQEEVERDRDITVAGRIKVAIGSSKC